MALYELRIYTLRVGAMAEAVKLYQEVGFPALQKGSHERIVASAAQACTGSVPTSCRSCCCSAASSTPDEVSACP